MAMKRRRTVLQAERLEARQLPDVALWQAAACAPPALPPAQEGTTNEADLTVAPAPSSSELQTVANRVLKLNGPASEQLETFFAQPEELEQLFAPVAPAGTETTKTPLRRSRMRGSEDEAGLFSLHPQAGDCESFSGWLFLCNYAKKAIRNYDRRFGPLPDHEDLVQQVFVEWWEQVGADQQALANLSDRGSAELQVLRKVVPRVLSRARYDYDKQVRMAESVDTPNRSRVGEQDWADLRIDLESGVGRLGDRERRVLELRRQGKTFDEIGPELGMSKQWAFDVCQAVLSRLQNVYCGMDG